MYNLFHWKIFDENLKLVHQVERKQDDVVGSFCRDYSNKPEQAKCFLSISTCKWILETTVKFACCVSYFHQGTHNQTAEGGREGGDICSLHYYLFYFYYQSLFFHYSLQDMNLG